MVEGRWYVCHQLLQPLLDWKPRVCRSSGAIFQPLCTGSGSLQGFRDAQLLTGSQSGVAAVKLYGGSSKKYQAQKYHMIQPFHFRIESRISPVFIAGWFTIAKTWEQPTRPLTDESMSKTQCIKWETARTFRRAQGTLLHVTWNPGWEASFGENGYMYI